MAHRAGPLSQGAGAAGALLILAALEAAWLGWFLVEPLPNVANIGGRIARWMLLAKALPQVVPGVRFEQSYLGQAVGNLGHVENLPQRLPIVLGAALIAASALGLGSLVLGALGLHRLLDRAERIPLAFGLGAIGLGLMALIAGRAGLLGPWPIRVGLGPLVVLGISELVLRRGERPRMSPAWLAPLLVVAPFVVVMALGAMLPATDFDAIEYHLQGPKEYFQAGRVMFLPHNVYTSMPFGVEMLHLLGMEVLGDWWWGAPAGQLVVAAFAPASAALVAVTARRWASPRAAWVAAAVYLTTPWVVRVSALPYVEGPLCFYHAALVWAAARAWSAGPDLGPRLWAVTGLLAGGAMSCKYPALISAVIPFGLLALVAAIRDRSAKVPRAFAAGAAVVMTPWLAKNALDTGNPVYPLAYNVFGGRYWDAELDAKWSKAHGPRPVSMPALVASALDVAGRSDWQSPLYVALAPLALFRPGSRRAAGALWAFAASIFLTWWLLTHRLDRFWLPILPPLAVLAGLGADWTRGRGWSIFLGAILILSIAANLVFVSTELVAGPNDWTADLGDLRDRVPAMLNRPLARLDAELPPDAKILLVGQAAVFHLRHPIVYNTVFNHETLETLARDRPPGQLRRALRQRGVTHVYVDWSEIDRYRSPGNYGFSAFVTPGRLAEWVGSGVLEPPIRIGPRQELYRVHSDPPGGLGAEGRAREDLCREGEAWTR